MPKKSLIPIFLVPTLLLLIPLVAMRFTTEVNWGTGDFAIAWILFVGTGLAYRLATQRISHVAYRVAMGTAVLTSLALIWVNLAVGLIGDEANSANLLYLGVLVVGIAGTALARLRPTGMAHAMWATAGAQLSVPLLALLFWRAPIPPFVWSANLGFAALFAVSGMLFRQAARRATFSALQ